MDLLEIQRAIRAGLKPLEAQPAGRLSAWADKHFYMSTESSYEEKPWKSYPFQVAILDCMGNDEIEEVTIKKSARIGYTKMLVATLLFNAAQRRRNQAVWQPTDEDSDEFVKIDLEPALRDVPIMGTVFPEFLQRHRNNTLRQKLFIGSVLHMRGGKAAKNYRRLSVDVVALDEIDGFDEDVQGEGNPVELARKRLEGATYPKILIGSTPKSKLLSQVAKREEQAQKRYRYFVPCPSCGFEHPLRWGSPQKVHEPKYFKWTMAGEDEILVTHECPACHYDYTQAEYLRVWHLGRWIAQDRSYIGADGHFYDEHDERIPVPRSVGINIWTAYSPQTDWDAIVRQYVSALARNAVGDNAELKTFVNLTLGETWEDEVKGADGTELKQRAEPFPLRTVPLGALILVAGVDVQDNRFEIRVWGIGRGEEMWTVDMMSLTANPADDRDWAKLDSYLQTRFPHAAGGRLGLEAVAVDTGGHFTHQVYNFCRSRTQRRIFAVKGETRDSQPIKGRCALMDVNVNGRILKQGVKLWHVGTDTAKDLIFERFDLPQKGPGFIHFSNELPDEFYMELTAEGRIVQKTAHGEKHRWVTIRARNETLDCTVYALFAAQMLDLHRYTDRMWARLELAVQPPTGDLFLQREPVVVVETAPAVAPAAPVQTSAPPPRRQGVPVASDDWSSRL